MNDEPALDDTAARLAVAVGRLNRALRRDAPSGLGAGSLSALATVVRHGPVRLGDVAAREGIAPPTLTRIVVTLEEAGHVLRTPDPTDRRATVVEATVSGRDLISGAGSSRAASMRERLAGLPDRELAALVHAMPVLEALAADDLPQLRPADRPEPAEAARGLHSGGSSANY